MEQDSLSREYVRSGSLPVNVPALASPEAPAKSLTSSVQMGSSVSSPMATPTPPVQSTSSWSNASAHVDSSIPSPPSQSTTSVQTQTTDTLGNSEGNVFCPNNDQFTGEDHAKLPFSCGCGECPALDFFTDSHSCPNPLPTVSKFPYLDTSGLTEEEHEDLEIQLNDDFLGINHKYAAFTASLRKSLKDRNISPMELADSLMDLRGHQPLSESPGGKGVGLLENRYSEIKDAESITRVFEILSDYCSFFNYDIIAFITTSLGSDVDKQNLTLYEAALETYSKHHVFECPSYSKRSPKLPDLVLKVDPKVTESNAFTVASLRRFKSKIARVLKVTKHSLKLCSIKEGCLEITFQIPPHIKEAILSLSYDQKEALHHLGVQRGVCEGTQFYSDSSCEAMSQKVCHILIPI